MKVLKFKCKLLTDIILNRKAATEGPNETLDFIPGNNFLGIVAGQLYGKISPQESLTLFHSGRVRFGDAHPSAGGFRSLKAPLSMFYPKLGKPDEELYIINRIPDPGAPEILDKQLKQCRSGFYDFSTERGERIATTTDFAVKSAYDKGKRRSKDEQMFGYQSLCKGIEMYFSVEAEDEIYISAIRNALVGKRNIGRSRSAQYGLVEITEEDYGEVKSCQAEAGYASVYADGRLIFLDEDGMPTFRPDATMLALEGEIDWEKSQLRTFRYAPWNFKRQCFDTDRCGFEKGSVFVVKLKAGSGGSLPPRYVGSYINEGFGRVIYNPAFLESDAEGKSTYRLVNNTDKTPAPETISDIPLTPLLEYLMHLKGRETDVYRSVNEWVKENGRFFKGETFSSQWGTIRSMATAAASLRQLKSDLFKEKEGYLMHGVAKDKWEEKNRIGRLSRFIATLDEATGGEAVVNLAAEMAKLCNADKR